MGSRPDRTLGGQVWLARRGITASYSGPVPLGDRQKILELVLRRLAFDADPKVQTIHDWNSLVLEA